MEAELMALAAAASAALVGAMTRDGWEATKRVVVGLWRRGVPEAEPVVTAELEAGRAELLAARARGDDEVQADLVTEWRARLRRLLAEHPELADALRAELGLAAVTAPVAGDTMNHSGYGNIISIRGGVRGGVHTHHSPRL